MCGLYLWLTVGHCRFYSDPPVKMWYLCQAALLCYETAISGARFRVTVQTLNCNMKPSTRLHSKSLLRMFQSCTMIEATIMSSPHLSKNWRGQGNCPKTAAMILTLFRLRNHTSPTLGLMYDYGELSMMSFYSEGNSRLLSYVTFAVRWLCELSMSCASANNFLCILMYRKLLYMSQ